MFDDFPYHQTVLHHTTAELTELRGWSEDLGECRTLSDLPDARARVPAVHRRAHPRAGHARRRGARREQTLWTEDGMQTLLGRSAHGAEEISA